MLDPFASATETIHPLGQLRLGDQEGRADAKHMPCRPPIPMSRPSSLAASRRVLGHSKNVLDIPEDCVLVY